MGRVEVIHFNPHRPVLSGLIGRLLPVRRPLNNFGDLLGPLVVQAILEEKNIHPAPPGADEKHRLLTVGSILHFAMDGDTIWGSGRNGKIPDTAHRFTHLDVRAVRGPRTREFLERRGIAAPEVYGDPGLLIGRFYPALAEHSRAPARPYLYVPNYNDLPRAQRCEFMLDPRSPVLTCLETIATSSLVVGSSLHAVIVAEALGIPARLIRSSVEDEFKYSDYYLGTGRSDFRVASSVREALSLGGERLPRFDPAELMDAFPIDLWGV